MCSVLGKFPGAIAPATFFLNVAVVTSMIGGCYAIMSANLWNIYAICYEALPLNYAKMLSQKNRFGIPLVYLLLQWCIPMTILMLGIELVPIQKLAVLGIVIAYFMSVMALLTMYRRGSNKLYLPLPVALLALVPCGAIGIIAYEICWRFFVD